MVNVLIIDDEEPLREAIRILGDWEGLGIGQVLEATDGQKGLAMLAEHDIDLAIVDMKMPVLNGMELLRIIERDYPDLLTIVISGYNDFEYTRQAIRSKVVDYLLKPVNRSELNQALAKAVNVLEAKRKMTSESISKNITLNMSLPKLKEKIYLSIIERSHNSPLSDAMLPLIGADKTANRFIAVVIRVMNLEEVGNSRFQRDVDLLHFAIANVINEFAEDQYRCFSFANPKREREIITILTMNGGYREDMVYRAIHQMKKVASTLDEIFGTLVCVGIGEICDDVKKLSASYDSARSFIDGIDLFKMNKTTVVHGAPEASLPPDNHSLVGRVPLIRGALENGSLSHAKGILLDYAGKWRDEEMFGIGEADRALQEFLVLMNDLAMDFKVPPERLPINGRNTLRDLGIGTDFATFDQYEAMLMRLLEYYGNEIRGALTSNKQFDVADIKTYIDNHYFEDIKISLFAEKYYLSREYLMKLFKQQFGVGIHEYVQKVRMDKAKQLLDDPSLKIQDISAMLGYKDKNYFSKAFRNYYSVSPTEYRDGQTNS
ncbi:response regulator transcription factor [Cohnella herbarum]|uniref:Response regulator n=1 Tax=Cohnella herbarum TaxID=2728023 RepID=A0A7Z2VLV6_9BACL|nr:response regulator [Cohnella herbarum]QJD85483.1 response regulator [Cohnella herbarum]